MSSCIVGLYRLVSLVSYLSIAPTAGALDGGQPLLGRVSLDLVEHILLQSTNEQTHKQNKDMVALEVEVVTGGRGCVGVTNNRSKCLLALENGSKQFEIDRGCYGR